MSLPPGHGLPHAGRAGRRRRLATRHTQIIYDAVGNWTTARQLTYWHCLDDENWEAAE